MQNAEIAFFGGSFTAIDPDYRLALLKTAHAACETYGFAGIRCSTRPDAIDDERLTVLKQYGVTAIELGAQSMDSEVLLLNRRGHTAKDVENAARLIRAYGFELGLQMMTGLPGDSDAKAMKTVKRLLALKPNTMRIYPTIVLENTPLCDLYRAGKYTPQTLEEAVSLCAKLIPMIEQRGVKLIRVGLHASEELETVSRDRFTPLLWSCAAARSSAKTSLKRFKPETIRKLRSMLTRACFPLRSDRKKKICSISLSTATPCTSARMLRFPAAYTGYDRQVNRCF